MVPEFIDTHVDLRESAPPFINRQASPGAITLAESFARVLNLTPCFTPVASPESNGLSEAFVKTFKRDYVRVHPLPDAKTALSLIAGRGLQREPSTFRAQHPLASRVQKSPIMTPGCPARQGQLHRSKAPKTQKSFFSTVTTRLTC